MEISIAELKEAVKNINEKIGDIYIALMGDNLSKSGGLISRLSALEEKIEEMEKAGIRTNIYVNIIYLLSGSLLSLGIGALVNYLIKHS